jgi:hypothetical protein
MKTGIKDTYNGTIHQWRQEGQTLQQIGDKTGVTRERIRQILNKCYGGTRVKGSISENKLAHALGFPQSIVRKARIDGIIKPSYHYGQSGITRYDASPANITLITKALLLGIQKYCVHCGKPRLPFSKKYCPECAKASQRNYYSFMSPEAKKRHNAATKHYQQEHPEKIKEIHQRAVNKWLRKRSEKYWASQPKYILKHQHDNLPAGTIVIGVLFESHCIITSDGQRISINCLKKV